MPFLPPSQQHQITEYTCMCSMCYLIMEFLIAVHQWLGARSQVQWLAVKCPGSAATNIPRHAATHSQKPLSHGKYGMGVCIRWEPCGCNNRAYPFRDQTSQRVTKPVFSLLCLYHVCPNLFLAQLKEDIDWGFLVNGHENGGDGSGQLLFVLCWPINDLFLCWIGTTLAQSVVIWSHTCWLILW